MSSDSVGVEVLRTLHRIHRQLADLDGRLDRGPKKIKAGEANMKHQEGLLEKARDQLKALRMAADAKQVTLKAGETKIDELKTKLNTANSNREYQVLKDQIAATIMANSVLDDEILEGWEKIEQFTPKVTEAETALDLAQKKAEEVRQEITKEEPLIRADSQRLRGELTECETHLPGPIREMYDRVVRQRREDALASIENQYCTGCHQHVPLNVCAEILLARPMFCKSCGRLLYMPEGDTSDV